ncbi:hypothetical protein [Acidocella sp.]|uniref:hypothetical protein n=1 Tax=Acidocella sp. TaxID=50710 RepID=UPI003D02B07F
MSEAAEIGYSAAGIQEIKYDCLAYLKEFGAMPGGWVIALTDRPDIEIGKAGLRHGSRPWMSRGAISARAARSVADFLCARFTDSVQLAGEAQSGRFIVLFQGRAEQHGG